MWLTLYNLRAKKPLSVLTGLHFQRVYPYYPQSCWAKRVHSGTRSTKDVKWSLN